MFWTFDGNCHDNDDDDAKDDDDDYDVDCDYDEDDIDDDHDELEEKEFRECKSSHMMKLNELVDLLSMAERSNDLSEQLMLLSGEITWLYWSKRSATKKNWLGKRIDSPMNLLDRHGNGVVVVYGLDGFSHARRFVKR